MTVHPLAEPFLADGDPSSPRGRTGVLLSHGFTGSPASMKGWGEYLAGQGYAVSVPRLPGHGTTWRDMNTTTWADWSGEVDRAFETLSHHVDSVFVCGLSMGGGLALRLAADRPDRVAGLVLVNPAVGTNRKDVKLLPVLKHLVPSFPGIANDIKKPGIEEHGYSRTPLRAADSMFRGYKVLRSELGRVTCPVLLYRSAEDHVVDPSSARIILSSVSSSDTREEILENSYHVATLDNDAERIFEGSAAFIERVSGAIRRS
ncbi:MAG: esterase [Marmoricola sp.]|nr:esterase [Marmoricola sp.]